jgi:two-component sensor histidine kinase
MKIVNLRYWLCQIIGWGLWSAFGIYLYFVVYKEMFETTFSTTEQLSIAKNKFWIALSLTFVTAILITHALRAILKKINWMRFNFNQIVFIFLISAISSGFGFYFISDKLEKGFNVSLEEYKQKLRFEIAKSEEEKIGLHKKQYYNQKDSLTTIEKNTLDAIKKATRWSKNENGNWEYQNSSNLASIYQSIILTSLWLLIYVVWHYVDRNRKDQLSQLKLETTVKELELKTIKAHINPHFIFNSLNSIRALVDENPERARKAITELSNLLRSSMQAEKTETVTLENELKIVNDYLALEKIRFEDRLQVQLQIDEDTFDQQVPPMMLQTIVENAIKHGIGKQIEGGVVIIKSDFIDNHYELSVENTGKIEKEPNSDGFGLKSTHDRIKLLFGKNANYTMLQKEENLVEVKVILPVKINS